MKPLLLVKGPASTCYDGLIRPITPATFAIDLEGSIVSKEQWEKVQAIDHDEIKADMLSSEELFLKLAGDMPKEMVFQRELLISRL